MAQGLLRVHGTIDLTQFWPQKQSDGDTVKVIVDPDGFEFTPDKTEAQGFHVTHVFDNAVVRGATRKPAVVNRKLTIRLQHADTPELHYQVPMVGTEDYRQYFGETAATELHDVLARAPGRPVPCEVRTEVDHPDEVFDTYGRMIGDIIVRIGGKEVNVNRWLVQKGWAFPAFYNSASPEEVREVSRCASAARKAKRGIWAHLSMDVAHPNLSLVFRSKATPDPQGDVGPVVIPKLFRRQVLWHVSQMDGRFSGSLHDFLAKQKDGWVKTADFLRKPGAKPSKRTRNLSTLVDKQGIFELGPGDLVFFEKPSTLCDAKGKKLVSWWTAAEKAEFGRAKPARVAA